MIDTKAMLTAAIAAAFVAGAFALTQPNVDPVPVTPPQETFDARIPDIGASSARVTTDGCVKVPRPAWAIDAAPADTDKVSLLVALYDLGRKTAIIESNSCPCDMQYPSWDAAEAELNQRTVGLDREQVFQLAGEITSAETGLHKAFLDICRSYRGDGQ